VLINKDIHTGHIPVPDVKRRLEKAQFCLDVDWVINAFHQVRLAKETSERLSVQTPWGQVQPRFKFIPRFGPASGRTDSYDVL
jgi:hypothetical protein